MKEADAAAAAEPSLDDLRCARRALLEGGVALLPTDTVYGLAAALDSQEGVAGLYALKGRPRSQPCQVLLYSRDLLERSLTGLSDAVVTAANALLPGPATCLVPDPTGRYAAAGGSEPGSVGLRAPMMPPAFGVLDMPLVATSANRPGGPDPRRVAEVPRELNGGVSCTVDIGELPGIASAVVDLRPVANGGPALLVRSGPDPEAVAGVLAAVGCTLASR